MILILRTGLKHRSVMKTNEYVWLCTEHEDEDEQDESDYERAQRVNREKMIQHGLSEQEADEFLEVLNRAAFDEEFGEISVDRAGSNITVTVTMETKVGFITWQYTNY